MAKKRTVSQWEVKSSRVSKRTSNPIREIVDHMKLEPHPDKPMISLSIGDPTVFGNLKAPENITDCIVEFAKSYQHNGYGPSVGFQKARESIAKAHSLPECPVTADDVVIGSGCSGALDFAIGVLGDEGHNILLPRPGFSLYQTLADSKGIECRFYDLMPEKSWEINFESLEKLADNNTIAILVNNPSNPCGSVYSEKHLKEIVQVAEKLHLPIISDEIYEEMVFSQSKFNPIAKYSKNVPILTVGGLAKRWMLPGWRLGWVIIHDRHDIFKKEVKTGLVKLSSLLLGANTLAQSIVPEALENTNPEYYQKTITLLEENANYTYERLSKVDGLHPIKPEGAMYCMVEIEIEKFKDIQNESEFCSKLIEEESVFCLPGTCFKYPNYFRIVFTPPMDKLQEAYNRVEAFCKNHTK